MAAAILVLLAPLAGHLGVLFIGVTLAALVVGKPVIYRNAWPVMRTS